MATASHVKLTPSTAGIYHTHDITSQSAKVASELLQENHDKYHIFFNTDGFHNHIAHHLLAIYALGATPDELQKAYHNNKGYQRNQFPVQERYVQDMSDAEKFKRFLGKEQYFHDYEEFFQKEMDAKGWQEVLKEYLFAKTEISEDLLVRMYAGFYHPIIHLGYGVEFEQPAIIAESLAQAAIHTNWPGKFLHAADAAARESKGSSSLNQLIAETQKSDKIRNSPHWEDGNKVRDGVLVRAREEMIAVAARWKVTPENLEQKTTEMINNSIYFAGASQRPSKQVKFDFFYMHCVNCSIFFSAFLKQDWLSVEDKCRLVEWKGRFDLALYVSRGCPELKLKEIIEYKPKNPNDSWPEIIRRVDEFPDDGHASKLIRAIAHGEQVSKQYEGEDGFVIKGDMFLKLGHMAIDSVEAGDPHWVRNAGFDQAWEKIPDRAKL